MSLFNRDEAADRALASKTNVPDGCYAWTRTQFGSPAIGDFDGDGAADAEDGWKAAKRRHAGDRNPPRGVPVFYLGGSRDNGHAAVSLGGGMIRSTDAGGRGKVATVPLDWPERVWGPKYAGWAEDLGGQVIPLPPAPPAPKPTRVSQARVLLKAALAQAKRKGRKQRADRLGKMLDDGPQR